jgi:hypothetical protein
VAFQRPREKKIPLSENVMPDFTDEIPIEPRKTSSDPVSVFPNWIFPAHNLYY